MPRDIPVGNGSMLVTFDRSYTLRDLFYPRVGQENHTAGQACRFGVWVDGAFSWIDSAEWRRELAYEHETLVTRVLLEKTVSGFRATRKAGAVAGAGAGIEA